MEPMWSFISVGLRGASVDRVSPVLFPPDSSDSQGLNRAGGQGEGGDREVAKAHREVGRQHGSGGRRTGYECCQAETFLCWSSHGPLG